MAKRVFKGRSITTGSGEGKALHCATFKPIDSIGKKEIKDRLSKSWINHDATNGLGTVSLKGAVILARDVASDGYSEAILDMAVRTGNAPLAFLFTSLSDRLASALIFSSLVAEKGIIAIDGLTEDFFEFVNDGDKIIIKEDGTVIVEKITALSVV